MITLTSQSGKVITLRPPKASDVQIMLDYINEIGREDIYVNVNPEALYTFIEEENFLKLVLHRIALGKQLMFLALHEGQLIGNVSITQGEKRSRHVGTFGITLRKTYRHDGIGYALSDYIISQAFSTLHLSLIILQVFAINEPALKLYQSLGFQEYGRLPQGFSYKDGFQDAILMYKTQA